MKIQGIPALQLFFGEYLEVFNRVRAGLQERQSLPEIFEGEEHIGDVDEGRIASLVSGYLHRRLQDIHEFHSRMLPASSRDELEDALYLAAAVSDEILLLETEWAGRDSWVEQLLEMKLFGSASAGETVFRRIDRLLAEREPSLIAQQLSTIYLLVLSMNFLGRYRSIEGIEPDRHALDQYREQLRLFAGIGDVHDVGQICPDAYRFNSSVKRERLAPLSLWHNYMAAAAVSLLLFSVVNWVWSTWPVINFLREVGGS